MVGYAIARPAGEYRQNTALSKPVFGLQLERCLPSDTRFSFKFRKEVQRSDRRVNHPDIQPVEVDILPVLDMAAMPSSR